MIASSPTPQTKTIIETTIKCAASGQPQPTVSWKRRLSGTQIEEQLNSGGKFTVRADNSLIISDTRYEDRGIYTCVATNNLVERRTAEASAQLNVQGWYNLHIALCSCNYKLD